MCRQFGYLPGMISYIFVDFDIKFIVRENIGVPRHFTCSRLFENIDILFQFKRYCINLK